MASESFWDDDAAEEFDLDYEPNKEHTMTAREKDVAWSKKLNPNAAITPDFETVVFQGSGNLLGKHLQGKSEMTFSMANGAIDRKPVSASNGDDFKAGLVDQPYNLVQSVKFTKLTVGVNNQREFTATFPGILMPKRYATGDSATNGNENVSFPVTANASKPGDGFSIAIPKEIFEHTNNHPGLTSASIKKSYHHDPLQELTVIRPDSAVLSLLEPSVFKALTTNKLGLKIHQGDPSIIDKAAAEAVALNDDHVVYSDLSKLSFTLALPVEKDYDDKNDQFVSTQKTWDSVFMDKGNAAKMETLKNSKDAAVKLAAANKGFEAEKVPFSFQIEVKYAKLLPK